MRISFLISYLKRICPNHLLNLFLFFLLIGSYVIDFFFVKPREIFFNVNHNRNIVVYVCISSTYSETHSFKSPSRSIRLLFLILFSRYSTRRIFTGTRQFTRKCIHLNHHLALPFPRAYLASSSFFSFLFAVRLFSPHLRRHALCLHDVTRVGITHEGRVVYQGVRMCQDRREGRDSFEPRLVFASPCVPRTSYFNETVCLLLSHSLSYFLSFFFFLSLLPTSPYLLFALFLSSSRL